MAGYTMEINCFWNLDSGPTGKDFLCYTFEVEFVQIFYKRYLNKYNSILKIFFLSQNLIKITFDNWKKTSFSFTFLNL